MPWTDKEYDKKYHREYMRDLRAWWKSTGKCTSCGKQDAYTLGGRSWCAECAEHRRISQQGRDLTRQYARVKAQRDERRAAGLCTQCGRELPKGVSYSFVMCPVCRAKAQQTAIKKRRRQGIVPRNEFVERGLCALCGKNKPADIELTFLDRKTVLCESCYKRSEEACRKGREVFAEKHGGQTFSQWLFEQDKRLREGKKIGEQKARQKANERAGS